MRSRVKTQIKLQERFCESFHSRKKIAAEGSVRREHVRNSVDAANPSRLRGVEAGELEDDRLVDCARKSISDVLFFVRDRNEDVLVMAAIPPHSWKIWIQLYG